MTSVRETLGFTVIVTAIYALLHNVFLLEVVGFSDAGIFAAVFGSIYFTFSKLKK